ncbi:hypothetical protein ACJX0J_016188, partial [Zea mays]
MLQKINSDFAREIINKRDHMYTFFTHITPLSEENLNPIASKQTLNNQKITLDISAQTSSTSCLLITGVSVHIRQEWEKKKERKKYAQELRLEGLQVATDQAKNRYDVSITLTNNNNNNNNNNETGNHGA